MSVKRRVSHGSPDLENVFRQVIEEYRVEGFPYMMEHRGEDKLPHRTVTLTSEIIRRTPEGGTVVDVGAGYGLVPRMLHKLGYHVIALEAKETGPWDIDLLAKHGIETRICTVGDDPIPFDPGTVDAAFAGDVVEHLPHSPKRFMLDLREVLKPGGWLLLDTPNATCLRTRLKMLAGFSNWPTLEAIYDHPINVHHHKEYTLEELTDLFVRAGFLEVAGRYYEGFWNRSLKRKGTMRTMGAKVEEMSSFGPGFNPKHPYEYARVAFLGLSKMAPSLQSNLLVAGRKPVE